MFVTGIIRLFRSNCPRGVQKRISLDAAILCSNSERHAFLTPVGKDDSKHLLFLVLHLRFHHQNFRFPHSSLSWSSSTKSIFLLILMTVQLSVQCRKWSRDRKWSPKWTANDHPRPQVIPKVDRKGSREMEWISWDWLQKRTDYKKETFFSRLLKKKGRRTLHLRSIYTRR